MYTFSEELDYDYGHDCCSCSEKENKLDDVKYWLQYLIKQFYSQDELNLDECERSLEELCHVVGIKIPHSELNLGRKTVNNCPVQIGVNQQRVLLQEWAEFNNQYLKQLAS